MAESGIDFLRLTKAFEEAVQADYPFELLELHYAPYSFGSGLKAYRINGRSVKLVYDGKDFLATLLVTEKHTKYPRSEWTEIFSGSASCLLSDGIRELKIYLL